jgi:hypothetical protein
MLQLAAALCKDFIKTPWTFVAADDVRLSRTNNSEDPTDEDNMRTAENKSRTELEVRAFLTNSLENLHSFPSFFYSQMIRHNPANTRILATFKPQ